LRGAVADATDAACERDRDLCLHGPPVAASRARLVEEVRGALAGAGQGSALVRVATAADPAPAGSILYVVPLDGACVLAFQYDFGEPVTDAVVGTLPGGGCLSG
ncbi:hypothetical protein, partial [Luedemannella flava]|uniref:hypothetical protein n=1 Tax=Luedemannella flava TaxID=349316 RepID=UPI0031D14851